MSKPWISSRDGGKRYPGKARSSAGEEKNPGRAALCWPWVSAFSACACCGEKVAGMQGALRLKLKALNSCLAVTHICKGVSFRDQGISWAQRAWSSQSLKKFARGRAPLGGKGYLIPFYSPKNLLLSGSAYNCPFLRLSLLSPWKDIRGVYRLSDFILHFSSL